MSTTSDLCVVASLATLAAARWAAEAAPTASPEAVPPKIKEIHVQKVGSIDRPEAAVRDEAARYLWDRPWHDDPDWESDLLCFRDTFGYDGDNSSAAPGAPNRRSNAFERSEGATEIIPAPVGEGWILWESGIQRWMYTYLNERTASIELREARP